MHRIVFLVIATLGFSHIAKSEPRTLSVSEPHLYLELSYDALLYFYGPELAKSLERPKGKGTEKMPWQKFDDKMRDIFHPSPYGTTVLAREEHWNKKASLFSHSIIYSTLTAPFFLYDSDKWLGTLMTMVHCIETSFTINRSLRALIGRYRPRVMYHDEPQYDDSKRNSFPSGHAQEAFAWASTAVFVFDLDFTWTTIAYSAASLASLGRLPGGQHYFTDLLAGATVGILVPWGVYESVMAIERSKQEKTTQEGFSFRLNPTYMQLSYKF